MTHMSEAARRERIQAAVEAVNEVGRQHERVELPWNGVPQLMDVIRIPLDAVVLNPRSHRIKAELESSPYGASIAADPFTEKSQEAIADILRTTDGFAALKADLSEHGQRDFGVVTRTGLLVNANTRAVALRDLREAHVKVAVLPGDADQSAIEELEAYLQLRVERKQAYSFPNEMIFVQDMKNRGITDDALALQLGWAPSSDARDLDSGRKKVRQAIRMLALMRGVCASSGGSITLKFFENMKQGMQEIDAAYELEKMRDPETALRVQNARLIALTTGLGYRELRGVDTQLVTDYLAEAMAQNDGLKALREMGGSPAPDGGARDDLALFESGAAATTGPAVDLTPLMQALFMSHGQATVVVPGTSQSVDREPLITSLRIAFETAIDDCRRDHTITDDLQAPKTLLDEADRKVKKAKEALDRVLTHKEFSLDEVRKMFARLRRSIDAFEGRLPPKDSAVS
jgi:hypothetical protein